MAVAFHPDFDYVALAAGEGADAPVYIAAAELAASVAAACKLGVTSQLARFKGSQLDRITFQHPFLDRSVLGVLATYVTADQGTGMALCILRPRTAQTIFIPGSVTTLI